ncbi:MAG: efflux RND transporter periplasmic adaptor subunit [Anaerolineales bacterium]|nr:efflux RND transporter periplasmic adaptor subunit [Anaerolineales bacterium]
MSKNKPFSKIITLFSKNEYKIFKFTLKKQLFWVLIVVLFIVAGGATYYYYTLTADKKAAEEESTLQTAVAYNGEMVVMASGTGSVIAASEIDMAFEYDGTLTELSVYVGDKVKKGDSLAKLQTEYTEEEIQAEIASAELAVTQAQNSLESLYVTAEANKTSALNDISTYAEEVRDAQYDVDNYLMPSSLQGMDPIEALDYTKEQLDEAREAFEPYKFDEQNNSTRRALLELYNQAQSNYNSAVSRLQYQYILEVAEANLEKARTEYEAYKDGPTETELAEADQQIASAEADLASAKKMESVVELVAPWDGTVTAISADVGEYLGTTSFLTLADLDNPVLEVSLDESDMELVALGYTAEIVFDALPDVVYTGTVTTIDPSVTTQSNVNTITALVKLDKTQLAEDTTLPIGLSAAVDIIAGQAENAVLITLDALRDLGDGEYAVFVLENDEPVLRTVTVGLMDATMVQITSGLQAGEIVTTGTMQTTSSGN